MRTWFCALLVMSCLAPFAASAEKPIYESELLFPLEHWHNHGSCIVECANGDLIVCWFHGSGERRSDDVMILGARKLRITGLWTDPFVMADTPDFPDTNPCMMIDAQGRLWLLWAAIQANLWESALMKYKISSDYQSRRGAPVWETMGVLHMKPGEEFEATVRSKTEAYVAGRETSERTEQWIARNYEQAADKLTRRLGWFTRAHPYVFDDGRLLVGLYSDGFSFANATYSDDDGETWRMSEPMVGGGNIQPSFVEKEDGTLVAYMRDNGPLPKMVHVAESKDRGETWDMVYDHPELNNPGSGLEVMKLRSGRWAVVYNDEAAGRHSLALSLSEDEGRTYPITRHLELVEPADVQFSYPSIIQSRDGMIHVTYSYHLDRRDVGENRKSIKYATFNEAWILEGDPSSETVD